jgi:hypothetical protein
MEMPARNSRKCLNALCLLLLLATPGFAWRVFPLVSYSSSSGFLLGGVITHNMVPPFSPFALSSMAYYYTGGSLYAGPELLVPAGETLLGFRTDYSVDRAKKLYGWGNDGDEDFRVTADLEVQELTASCTCNPLGSILFRGGLLTRHSTVYDRSADGPWDTYPSSGFGSTWTVGPWADAVWPVPVPLNARLAAGFDLQLADGSSYSECDLALAASVPVGPSTEPAMRIRVVRHFDSASTPFPFLPSLGGDTGLRGFADGRFGGDWALLANLELRQRLVTVRLDEQTSMSFGLVLFGDAGQVADRLEETRWNRFHLDSGLGARITIPGGGTLRADFALSPEGLGIQMGLGELF